MNNYKITTLSKVHIGNDTLLQKGNDFIINGSYVDILSFGKLSQLVNFDEGIIQEWTDAIMLGKAEQFVRERFIVGHKFDEYCKRRICLNQGMQLKTLKECIHDGMGRPYIPGSSIKGAIRTAVLTILVRNEVKTLYEQNNIFNIEKDFLNKKAKDKDEPFRHFIVGDAYFDKGTEVAVRQFNLNITQNSSLIDYSKTTMVEAIKEDKSAEFRLNIKSDFFLTLVNSKIKDELELLKEIRAHTKRLLEEDIAFWESKKQYQGQQQYIKNLNQILEEVARCNDNETILRIGQASGWRFITGAWTEELKEKEDEKNSTVFRMQIVPICRPGDRDRYKTYEDFPKSRRIADNSSLFGFVKLTKLG